MADLTNIVSLTEFQRNSEGFIEGLNRSKEPLLLTVNGKVQAVVVDPVHFQEMEALLERQRFLAGIEVGLKDIDESRTRPIEEVFSDMKSKYHV